MRVDLHPRFLKRARKLRDTDRDILSESLRLLESGFGQPHLHSGLGIRRLRKGLFECRGGLKWRIVFFAEKGVLTAYDVMTHDELQSWLRNF